MIRSRIAVDPGMRDPGRETVTQSCYHDVTMEGGEVSDATKILTVRISDEEHELLRTYAFHKRSSMNDVVRMAIRAHLSGAEISEGFEELVKNIREQYRIGLDKLKDL